MASDKRTPISARNRPPRQPAAAAEVTIRLVLLGGFRLLHDGKPVAALVRNSWGKHPGWSAELLESMPPEKRPAPFVQLEHDFASLDEARRWLGVR